MIGFTILAAVAAGVLTLLLYSLALGIGPVPTSPAVARALKTLLPSTEGPIYELGCGWGGLAVLLARHYPDTQIVGYELSPLPYCIARLRALPHSNLTIRRRNFLKEPLQGADLLVCYLFPKGMARLDAKLQREGYAGQVLTHTFGFPRPAEREAVAQDLFKTRIWLYLVSQLPTVPPLSS